VVSKNELVAHVWPAAIVDVNYEMPLTGDMTGFVGG
jgi:hypothetical protein